MVRTAPNHSYLSPTEGCEACYWKDEGPLRSARMFKGTVVREAMPRELQIDVSPTTRLSFLQLSAVSFTVSSSGVWGSIYFMDRRKRLIVMNAPLPTRLRFNAALRKSGVRSESPGMRKRNLTTVYFEKKQVRVKKDIDRSLPIPIKLDKSIIV